MCNFISYTVIIYIVHKYVYIYDQYNFGIPTKNSYKSITKYITNYLHNTFIVSLFPSYILHSH